MSDTRLERALRGLTAIRDMPQMFVGAPPGPASWMAIGQSAVELAADAITEIESFDGQGLVAHVTAELTQVLTDLGEGHGQYPIKTCEKCLASSRIIDLLEYLGEPEGG